MLLTEYQEQLLKRLIDDYQETGDEDFGWRHLIELFRDDPEYLSTDMYDAFSVLAAYGFVGLYKGNCEFMGTLSCSLQPTGIQYFTNKAAHEAEEIRKDECRKEEAHIAEQRYREEKRRSWIQWAIPLPLSIIATLLGILATLNSIFHWIDKYPQP